MSRNCSYFYLSLLVLIAFLAPTCLSFLPTPILLRPRQSSCLHENMDDLRNMLETSWNVESMGQVPSTPQLAAEEAASSIIEARKDGLGNLCFVDLLLPQYDIQQGTNLYDEVEAVEFCRLISECLQTRSVIYVKDDKSLKTVSKVMEARERERQQEVSQQEQYEYEEVEVEIDEDDEEWDNHDEDEDDDDEDKDDKSSVPNSFDDFSDFDSAEVDTFFSLDASTTAPPSDADTFRQQLSSTWGQDEEEASEEPKQQKKKKRTKVVKKLTKRKTEQPEGAMSIQPRNHYRLASLFGDKKISNGPAMSESVVAAVKAHGLPKHDEETMILLSANSEAEMLAVRALVTKYKDSKQIVLVNCRLDPLPRELENCNTVYHLTPLIATSTMDERNLFRKDSTEERPPIKVVSIRRYPGEWEVYVDADGKGFELAERASADKFTKKGPTFDWIGGAIKAFLS